MRPVCGTIRGRDVGPIRGTYSWDHSWGSVVGPIRGTRFSRGSNHATVRRAWGAFSCGPFVGLLVIHGVGSSQFLGWWLAIICGVVAIHGAGAISESGPIVGTVRATARERKLQSGIIWKLSGDCSGVARGPDCSCRPPFYHARVQTSISKMGLLFCSMAHGPSLYGLQMLTFT